MTNFDSDLIVQPPLPLPSEIIKKKELFFKKRSSSVKKVPVCMRACV